MGKGSWGQIFDCPICVLIVFNLRVASILEWQCFYMVNYAATELWIPIAIFL